MFAELFAEDEELFENSKEDLLKEHLEKTEEERKQGKVRERPQTNVICCCGSSNCRIGPFLEQES